MTTNGSTQGLYSRREIGREGHVATVAPDGDGYVVTCPHGCKLGTSAHAPDEHAAAVRVQLHKMSTTPLYVRRA